MLEQLIAPAEGLERVLYEVFTLEERRQAELRLSEEEAAWVQGYAPKVRLMPQEELRGGKRWYAVTVV